MIRRLHLLLLRLLAVLLITQGVAAPAHCLELLARATGTPICTGGNGLQYGAGVPEDGPLSHHGADGCAVCHALPQGPVPAPLLLPPPSLVLAAASKPWPLVLAPSGMAEARPYTARAPPLA